MLIEATEKINRRVSCNMQLNCKFLTQLSCSDFLLSKTSCNFSPAPFGWASSNNFFAVVANSSFVNKCLDEIRNFAIVSLILGTGRFPSLSCNSNVLGPKSVLRLPGTMNLDAADVLNKLLFRDAA